MKTLFAIAAFFIISTAHADTIRFYMGSSGQPFDDCMGKMAGHTQWQNPLNVCFHGNGGYSEDAIHVVENKDWFPNSTDVTEVDFVCSNIRKENLREEKLVKVGGNKFRVEMPCAYNAKQVRAAMERILKKKPVRSDSSATPFKNNYAMVTANGEQLDLSKNFELVDNGEQCGPAEAKDHEKCAGYENWILSQMHHCSLGNVVLDAQGCAAEYRKIREYLSGLGLEIYSTFDIEFNGNDCVDLIQDLGPQTRSMPALCYIGHRVAERLAQIMGYHSGTSADHSFTSADIDRWRNTDEQWASHLVCRFGFPYRIDTMLLCQADAACWQRINWLVGIATGACNSQYVENTCTQADVPLSYDSAGTPVFKFHEVDCHGG